MILRNFGPSRQPYSIRWLDRDQGSHGREHDRVVL